MFVVTGSTGHVGRLVAGELSSRGLRQRLLVRDPARAPDIAGAEVAVADYGDPESLAEALEPGDRVFMVSLLEGPDSASSTTGHSSRRRPRPASPTSCTCPS